MIGWRQLDFGPIGEGGGLLKLEDSGRETGVLKIWSPVLSPGVRELRCHMLGYGFVGSRRPALTNGGRPNKVQVEKDMDGVKPSVTLTFNLHYPRTTSCDRGQSVEGICSGAQYGYASANNTGWRPPR